MEIVRATAVNYSLVAILTLEGTQMGRPEDKAIAWTMGILYGRNNACLHDTVEGASLVAEYNLAAACFNKRPNARQVTEEDGIARIRQVYE